MPNSETTKGARYLRILIISDAWHPQVNGVVRTLSTVTRILNETGHATEVIGPDRFRTLPCPTYPDIRLSVLPARKLARLIDAFRPDALHIATEGPLGMAAAKICKRRGWRFTTAFHTRFPEYVRARISIPESWSYAFLRRFHNAGAGTMVATPSLRAELHRRGFHHLRAWSRGVDLDLFTPTPADPWEGLARPVFAYIGRVAVEKNIRAFLDLDLPGSKVVVGDGPARASLERDYPGVRFTGTRRGAELSASYAGSDVFVFPSLTDTYGLVMLESLACGTPVAAFPVTGPVDVIAEAPVGSVNADLKAAAMAALGVDRALCRPFAEQHSWQACTQLFLSHVVPAAEPVAVFDPAPMPIDTGLATASAAD